MGRDRRLRENDRLSWVYPRGDVRGGDFSRIRRQHLRRLPGGDGVQIDHAKQTLMMALQLDELHQGAEVVAQMQGAGRLHAGQDAVGTGIGRGGSVAHEAAYNPVPAIFAAGVAEISG